MFKFTAAPFHMWAPDVYQGAPTIVTLFFSLVPKIVFLSLFIRFAVLILPVFEVYFGFIFFFCGILSLFIGSLSSIYQNKLKRLLVYSSITNVGYFLMAVSCIQLEAFVSSFFFLFVYIFVLSSIFIFMLSFRYFSNNLKIKNIFELMSVSHFNFLIGVCLVVNFFSLLGLPPLLGFIAKFYLFLCSLGSDFFLFLFFAIFGSIVSAVVYLKAIRLILFNKYNNIFFFRIMPFIFCFWLSLFLIFNFFGFFYISELMRFFFVFIFDLHYSSLFLMVFF